MMMLCGFSNSTAEGEIVGGRTLNMIHFESRGELRLEVFRQSTKSNHLPFLSTRPDASQMYLLGGGRLSLASHDSREMQNAIG
jgi:hypothetical protein